MDLPELKKLKTQLKKEITILINERDRLKKIILEKEDHKFLFEVSIFFT